MRAHSRGTCQADLAADHYHADGGPIFFSNYSYEVAREPFLGGFWLLYVYETHTHTPMTHTHTKHTQSTHTHTHKAQSPHTMHQKNKKISPIGSRISLFRGAVD